MVQENAAPSIEPYWEKPAANDESASVPAYYYRARYYDPEIGRLVSEDPLGFKSGVNFYAYVNNNPINFNDPMGLERQFTLGVSGTLFGTPLAFIPSGGIGGGSVVGISLPDNIESLSDLAKAQFFVQGRATGLLGVGLFAGVSVDANVGRTDGPLPVGLSKTRSLRLEGNAGFEAAVGFSLEGNPTSGDFSIGNLADLIPDSASLKGGRAGAGFGFMLAGGVSQTVTAATPSVGELFNSATQSLSSLFTPSPRPSTASGGFVLYPNKPNTDFLQSVYAK